MNYFKFIGLANCLFLILDILFEIRILLYFDIYSLIIVIGGAIGYSLIKNNKKEYILNNITK